MVHSAVVKMQSKGGTGVK